jgi:hypothetical protein
MASRIAFDESLVFWFALLDLNGLNIFFELVRDWTPEQKNTQLPATSLLLVGNRLGVLVLAVLTILWVVCKGNSLTLDTPKAKRKLPFWQKRFSSNKPGLLSQRVPDYTLLTVTTMALRLMLKSRIFFAMCLFLIVVSASEIYFGYVHLENLGTQAIASSVITINRFINDVLPVFSGLFLLLIAAELCWRDSQYNFKQLVDSTPLSNQTLFLGRLLAVCAAPIAFISLVILVSVAMQLLFDGFVEWHAYGLLYLYVGLPLLIIAVVCTVIHHLLPNKYFALVLSFLVYAWLETNLLANLGVNHPLWTLGKTVSLTYSEIFGIGGNLDVFWATFTLRACLAMLVSLVCMQVLRRGETLSVLNPMTKRRYRWSIAASSMAAFWALSNIIVATHYESFYQSSSDRQAWKAGYEVKYSQYREMPVLSTEKVVMDVALEPEQGRVSIKAHYNLVNDSNSPISVLLLTTPRPFVFSDVSLEGASVVERDELYKTQRYRFETPIQPGETSQFSFVADYYPQGHQGQLSDKFLSETYVYLRMLRFMPWIGYLEHNTLKDNGLRREYGLSELVTNTLEEDLQKYQGDMSSTLNWAKLETKITTSKEHTAFAPGKLINQWVDGDKRIFHYQTDGPIRNLGHVVSTSLPFIREQVKGITLEVYYPVGRELWAERHMQSIKDTLKYATKNFGTMNGADLRLVPQTYAFPATGYALPQTIFIGEDVGFHVNLDDKDGFDHLYRRTAHETAHQWWGHGLNGAATEGEGVLIESLAKYTEAVMLKAKYGEQYVKDLIAFEQRRYLIARGRNEHNELPLYRADESYLIYSKGSAALYAIAQKFGEQHVNKALAKLVELHSYPEVPATTFDLVDYLKEGLTAQQANFINAWFFETQVSNIAITDVTVAQLQENVDVRVCVASYKDDVEALELIVKNDQGNSLGEFTMALEPTEDNTLCENYIVSEYPSSIEADPRLLFIDSDRSNNEFKIPPRVEEL